MKTPRTDAEHAKTLTPAYEYEGAEWEAWEWAKTLEKELIDAIEMAPIYIPLDVGMLDDIKPSSLWKHLPFSKLS